MVSFNSSTGEWVRCFHRSDGSEIRLVCFPYAGGSASYYYPMSEALAAHTETLALQYPGRQDRRREICIDNLSELADRIFDVLQDCSDGRPFAFFGHSMGAVLAFEVARRFQRAASASPAWLFASGSPAPSRLRGGTVHRRDDTGILAELRLLGGTDPRWLADDDLMASVLPAVRGDYTAIETHARGNDSLDCPVTMLVGDDDPHVTLDEAAAWQEHTSGAFALRVFAGGHFYLDTHRSAVIDEISTTLGRVVPVVSQPGRA
jgi:surfactin synthase thioesterase subunit